MPDITMCLNTDCPKADTCYRVQANSSYIWQSVCLFEYKFTPNGIECDHYYPVATTTDKKPKGKAQ